MLRAMIDSGSPFNLISQRLIAQRGIPGDSENIPLARDLNGVGIRLYIHTVVSLPRGSLLAVPLTN